MSKNFVCPDCGYEGSYSIVMGNLDILEKSEYLDLYYVNNYPRIKCKKCNWLGYGFQLLRLEEYKNKRRTELIDKMLK